MEMGDGVVRGDSAGFPWDNGVVRPFRAGMDEESISQGGAPRRLGACPGLP